MENKKQKKKGREYYILAGEPGVREMLDDIDMELSPLYFMVIKEHSKLGKLLSKEAKKRVNKLVNRRKYPKRRERRKNENI
ncbi:unnamed protein product [marine sediment metagenome]|uniref:Uncharacterized protein n=1 Tax=marine sediment metagenome TaxID=412755 RepID=X0XBP1_9ZZZZ